MNFNPSTIQEAFHDHSYNFIKDVDYAVDKRLYEHGSYQDNYYGDKYYNQKYDHEDKHKDKNKNDNKKWYETEQGMIYIGAGVVTLIGIVVILNQLKNKD